MWGIADELRGSMTADEFKSYMLGFIFYKHLSEKIEAFINRQLADDDTTFQKVQDVEMLTALEDATLEGVGYYLKWDDLFKNVLKRAQNEDSNLVEELARILKSISDSTKGTDSSDDFSDLFSDVDLTNKALGSSTKDQNELVKRVLERIDSIDFNPDSEADILGDAYEYVIGKFASGAGAKSGEFYTPKQVSKVLARIVIGDRQKLRSIYDPTCGSGSLLIRAYSDFVAKGSGKPTIYGQEKNRTTYNLARMNMIIHNIHHTNFNIKQEDTLKNPQHEGIMFDAIVANPPFSQKWAQTPSEKATYIGDDRFSPYGRLAPSSAADFAFIQHMIYQLDEAGTMAVVVPHGVLFRGAAEGQIRKHLIKANNYLDAVIGLPPNIFYGTSIPTCILVLKKCRTDSKNVLFIDASKLFNKAKNKNELAQEHIQTIIQTYENRKTVDKLAYLAPLSEIELNEYNLNIPRYVDTFEPEPTINLNDVAKQITDADNKIATADNEIAKLCKELNIDFPGTTRQG